MGFNIKTDLMDIEFEPTRVEQTNINICLNATLKRYHVPEIEHKIHVTNEILRSCLHTLPFTYNPKVILVVMLMNCALYTNAFTPGGGVSTSVIPCIILTEVNFDYNRHCQLQFGQYAKLNQENTQKIHQPTAKRPGRPEIFFQAYHTTYKGVQVF